jgi:hypothetical protein
MLKRALVEIVTSPHLMVSEDKSYSPVASFLPTLYIYQYLSSPV